MIKSVSLRNLVLFISDVMRVGAELVWSVCMLRKIWLEDMVKVSFDEDKI